MIFYFFQRQVILNAEFPVENFINSNKKYLEWFPVNYSVLYKASLINVPKQLVDCERLFDKNVIKIKKLVKDIGDLKDLISTEIKYFFLYDDSNFIKGTFFTELNKDIQAYGIISLLDNDSSKRLINSKNRIRCQKRIFNISIRRPIDTTKNSNNRFKNY